MNLAEFCAYHPDHPAKPTVYEWVSLKKVPQTCTPLSFLCAKRWDFLCGLPCRKSLINPVGRLWTALTATVCWMTAFISVREPSALACVSLGGYLWLPESSADGKTKSLSCVANKSGSRCRRMRPHRLLTLTALSIGRNHRHKLSACCR